MDCPGLLLVVARVAAEATGRGKFAQLVAHHVLGDVNRDKFITVMYCNSVSHEVRGYH